MTVSYLLCFCCTDNRGGTEANVTLTLELHMLHASEWFIIVPFDLYVTLMRRAKYSPLM